MSESHTGEFRWIDNHCHLGEDAAEALAAAQEAGVQRFIDVGCDLATSTSCVEHASRYATVFATVGLHPHEAKHGLDGLEPLMTQPKVVAVGECGLDYHYDHSPRDVQKQMFADQIGLAHRHGLPLVIHTREAWQDTFDVLDAEGVPERTIFHCFTGGPDEARSCLDRGAWLSFSGIVSFKSARDVQEAAQLCPESKLLVETDSPYLAPVPHRGKRNQPAWVSVVGEVVADLRGTSVAAIAQSTWANTHEAYPLLGAAT
jgi:TatD DNase family protein